MSPINHEHLLATALDLISSRPGRPRMANLRRAISSIYYAMFHCMTSNNADRIVGSSTSDRDRPVWLQIYRALEHRTAKNRCKDQMVRQFPLGIRDFAEVFETMHELRETADYNPEALFSVDEVWYWSKVVYSVIESFEATPPQHRRAFAAYLLLPNRS